MQRLEPTANASWCLIPASFAAPTTAAPHYCCCSAVTLDDELYGLDERQWDNSWAAQGTQAQPQDKQPSLLHTALADGVKLQQQPDSVPQQQPLQQQQQHKPAVMMTSESSNGTASRLVAAAVAAAAVPSSAAATGAAESGGLPADSAARVQAASAAQSVLPGSNKPRCSCMLSAYPITQACSRQCSMAPGINKQQ